MIAQDANNRPVVDERFALSVEKSLTFDGGTTNAVGDHDGTGDPATLFTVTGTVLMRIIGIVETTLTGASATVEVGTALTTAGLIAQTTATNMAVNELWHDATPDASVELTSVMAERVVSQNVILTVSTANVTAGKIKFVCFWYPLTANGSVVAA